MKHQKFIFLLCIVALCAIPAWPQIPLNAAASRAIGQPQLTPATGNPNLVEGREVFAPEGVAIDTSLSPPAIYVADTGNNRVLGWKNASQFNNGAPADLIIGQRDRFTTAAQGPGTNLSVGFNSPTALAVRGGSLYVVDAGNNRILRFPNPFAQTDLPYPDLVIGQTGFTSNSPNQGNGVPSEKTLVFAPGGNTLYTSSVTFDASGNLWVVDPGNRRVLRYPANSLNNNNPSADLVIGQLDYVSQYQPISFSTQTGQTAKNQFMVPSGLMFDQAGRLYVSDSDSGAHRGRVLVFTPPFVSGMQAKRILGLVVVPQGTQVLQPTVDRTVFIDPEGMFMLGSSPAIIDAGSSRIVTYDPYDQWPDEGTTYSPMARLVFGQNSDFSKRDANNKQPRPGRLTFANPLTAIVGSGGNELFLSDSGNNRVLVLPISGGFLNDAVRVLGQERFDTGSINLIEGREFQFVGATTRGNTYDAGIALDTKSDPPHLYVADPYNHRVLGFRDARNLHPGDKADLVIGEPDFQTAMCNYPTNDVNQPTATSLCRPVGLTVDTDGNLYVADSGNGRVLRFPVPFARAGQTQTADLVLGQSGFTSRITDPDQRHMSQPYGVTFINNNGLLVSDPGHNRALFFANTGGGFTNGMVATKVFGQSDFVSTATSASPPEDNRFRSPGGAAADTDGHAYIADTGNNRVLIFDTIGNIPQTNARAAVILSGLSSPKAVYVSPITGEIWALDSGNSRALRFLRFDQLPASNYQPKDGLNTYSATLAITQDQFGDVFLADALNRVSIYYPGLAGLNAANYLVNRPVAPGSIASLFPATSQTRFGTDTKSYTDLPQPVPLPTSLADTQVTVNGTAAPLFYVSPNQINFQVPNGAPDSGTADVLVTRVSTGQIVAAGQLPMDIAAPGLFSSDGSGNGQIAVLNQDNTVNSPTNPAQRGSVISIYATGQGRLDNAPGDGAAAPSGTLIQTPEKPRVFIGICWVDDPACTGEPSGAGVTYSGLAPGFVGLWQINVRIPNGPQAPIGNQTQLIVQYKSRNSNGVTSSGGRPGVITTISVK